MQDVIKINQEDNVAVALRPIAKGETLDIAGTPVTTLEEIPQGHKVAIKPIAQGGNVIKYGFRIGIAKEDIKVFHRPGIGESIQEIHRWKSGRCYFLPSSIWLFPDGR